MRVRLRFNPREMWVVESKKWYELSWVFRDMFGGDNSYHRALAYAKLLKYPIIEDLE